MARTKRQKNNKEGTAKGGKSSKAKPAHRARKVVGKKTAPGDAPRDAPRDAPAKNQSKLKFFSTWKHYDDLLKSATNEDMIKISSLINNVINNYYKEKKK